MISVGYELNNVLAGWEDALQEIPDQYLSRAYDHAANGWDWTDKRNPFGPDAIASAYTLLVVEDRQRAEAERRNAARRNRDTYRCWHCLDLGYQPVWAIDRDRWYSSLRPCSCEAAPLSYRSVSPIEGDEWERNKIGEYARRVDLIRYGAPNDKFENVTYAGQGE